MTKPVRSCQPESHLDFCSDDMRLRVSLLAAGWKSASMMETNTGFSYVDRVEDDELVDQTRRLSCQTVRNCSTPEFRPILAVTFRIDEKFRYAPIVRNKNRSLRRS